MTFTPKQEFFIMTAILMVVAATLGVAVATTYQATKPLVRDEVNKPEATTSGQETATAEATPSPSPTPTPTPTPTPNPPPAQTTFLPEVNKCLGSTKRVALTFDAGSGDNSFRGIVDTLLAKDVPGTFFLTGAWAANFSAHAQELGTYGSFGIYNHTYSHPDLKTVSNDEILSQLARAETTISGYTGRSTKPYMRMPYGSRDARVWQTVWNAGYRSIYWTTDALDWQTTATDQSVIERVESRLVPGDIILMHIGDDITGRVLGSLIDYIRGQGYALVSLSNCLQ